MLRAMVRECIARFDQDLTAIGQAAAQAAGLKLELEFASQTCLLRWLIEQNYTDDNTAVQMAAVIVWLAAKSPAGAMFDTDDTIPPVVHYEITDIYDPHKGKGQNFRLVLANEPPPD
jgi:hypothetical protein